MIISALATLGMLLFIFTLRRGIDSKTGVLRYVKPESDGQGK